MRTTLTHPTRLVIVAVLLGTMFALAGPGSVSYADDNEIILEIKDGVELEQMLKAVGQVMDVPLIWDPNDKQVRGKRVISAVNIQTSKKDLLGAVRSLLTFYELGMIPVGKPGHEIMLLMDARRTTSILKLKAVPIELNDRNLESYRGADGLYVTTMIKAPHMQALRNARNALTRIVTGQNIGNVTEVPDARAFIVTDFAPNVVSIYQLVKQMDEAAKTRGESAPNRIFSAIELKHARARSVMGMLVPLFPGQSTPVPAGRGQQPTVRTGRGPRIQADERTNQILITGTQGEVEQIRDAIASVDVPAPTPDVEAHVIRLEHLNAYEAANEIQAMIGSSKSLWRSVGDQHSRPGVVASQRINAVLVSADGVAFDRIRRLLQEMDEIAGEPKAEDKKGNK